jgi:hypothetical protein
MRITLLVICLFCLTGCPGTIDQVTTNFGGVEVKEQRTDNLICGVAQRGQNISVSCVDARGGEL